MNTFEKYLLLKGTILGIGISILVLLIYLVTNPPNKVLFGYLIALFVLAIIINILTEKWISGSITMY